MSTKARGYRYLASKIFETRVGNPPRNLLYFLRQRAQAHLWNPQHIGEKFSPMLDPECAYAVPTARTAPRGNPS